MKRNALATCLILILLLLFHKDTREHMLSMATGNYYQHLENVRDIGSSSNTNQEKQYKTLHVQSAQPHESEDQFMARIGQRMKERRHLLQTVCKQLELGRNRFAKQKLMVLKRYNLVHCRIPKAGSTNLDRVFWQLTNLSDYGDFPFASSRNPHEIEQITERYFAKVRDTDGFIKSILVRDPYERLVSAFKKKIHGTNATGLIKDHWLNHARVPPNVTFDQFISHVTFPGRVQSTFERHWATFQFLCQPCHVTYDVIAHLETIAEDSRYLLNLIGAPKNVTFPSAYGKHGKPATQRSQLSDVYSTVSRHNFGALYRMFAGDFLLFGYSRPNDLGKL